MPSTSALASNAARSSSITGKAPPSQRFQLVLEVGKGGPLQGNLLVQGNHSIQLGRYPPPESLPVPPDVWSVPACPLPP